MNDVDPRRKFNSKREADAHYIKAVKTRNYKSHQLTLNAQKYDEGLLIKNTFAINTVSDNTDPIFAARPCTMKYENINRSPFILQYDNECDA